ncbi:head GIN domain-containing protein [Mariniphaga sp.]|uniref:head GIN domain-containing protein n=1 Tax=Mariniphaga sp. TaxID=1954475 RepID=UPI003568C242
MNQKTSNVFNLSFLLLLFFSLSFSFKSNSQNNNYFTKTYEIGEFSELFLEGAFGVELIQGNKSTLEVRAADERAFDYLNVTNQRDLLHLHVDRKPFDFSKVTLLVTFENLERLRILGGIRLETRGFLDLDDLEMLLEGGAKVNLQLKAGYVGIDNRGGVLCELSGVSETLNVRLAGAGHVNAGELKADDVTFRIEGVGTGVVYAGKTLDATIKGAGKIKYRGNPEVNQSIEGLGSVERE